MEISRKLNHSILLKFIIFILLLWPLFWLQMNYRYIGELSATFGKGTCLKTFVDNFIPFNIYIIYPYLLSLLWPVIAGLFLIFRRKVSSIKFFSFFIASILIQITCYAIYLIFPTTASCVMINSYNPLTINLGVFQTIQGLYASSTPFNSFPSLHVVPMVFLSIFFYKNWRLLFWIFLPMAILASMGTVLLKFHVFADVLGGVLMGIFGYYVIYEKIAFKYLSKIFTSEEETIDGV